MGSKFTRVAAKKLVQGMCARGTAHGRGGAVRPAPADSCAVHAKTAAKSIQAATCVAIAAMPRLDHHKSVLI